MHAWISFGSGLGRSPHPAAAVAGFLGIGYPWGWSMASLVLC